MLTSDKLKSFLSDRPKIIKIHQVKRDGPELNRATKSPPPRLKMTDIKQDPPTRNKSKVYIIPVSYTHLTLPTKRIV